MHIFSSDTYTLCTKWHLYVYTADYEWMKTEVSDRPLKEPQWNASCDQLLKTSVWTPSYSPDLIQIAEDLQRLVYRLSFLNMRDFDWNTWKKPQQHSQIFISETHEDTWYNFNHLQHYICCFISLNKLSSNKYIYFMCKYFVAAVCVMRSALYSSRPVTSAQTHSTPINKSRWIVDLFIAWNERLRGQRWRIRMDRGGGGGTEGEEGGEDFWRRKKRSLHGSD